MNKIITLLITLGIAGLSVSAADPANPKKEKKAPLTLAEQTLKKFETVGLTDDQAAKIKEAAGAAEASMADVKKAAALTDEQRKAQQDAMKAAKDAGKDAKATKEAATAAVTLTDAQKEAQAKMKTIMSDFNKKVSGLLTDEQKAKMKGPQKQKQPK